MAERLAGQAREAPGGGFVVAEWRDPGGPPGPPRLIAPPHIHHADDEAWYVLEGRLRFRLDDIEVEAGPGEIVFAAPGVAHTFWNPGAEVARYLLLTTPNVAALIAGLHAPGAPAPAEVFRLHNSRLL